MTERPVPSSIAIAGAWGYIGRKLLEAATELGLDTYVLDPGDMPEDIDPRAFTRVQDPDAFYALDVDLYHLALHPQHRGQALEALLQRARHEPLLILNEKPMAPPEEPGMCRATIDAVEPTRAVMLFDFLELFDPMTHAIVDHLNRCDRVQIEEVNLYRGKDREDPQRPRNYKTMVHIQYQESVHCLAFLLNLLGRLRGDLTAVFADGIRAHARSAPYCPPNPQAYPYVIDGQCVYELELAGAKVSGRTDFKRGARFSKRKVIRGTADGRPFEIEADHLEGSKYLRIDGVDQGFAPDASAYRHILGTIWQWYRGATRNELMQGVFPNPRFARFTYQLSSLLWHCCRTGETQQLASADDLLARDPHFRDAVPGFPRYGD